MRIIHENLARYASIFPSRGAEDKNYPLRNAVSGNLHPETRVLTGDSKAIIGFDFGSAQNINGCLVRGHSLPDEEDIFVRGNSSETDPWTGADSGTLVKLGDNYLYYFFDSNKSHQYWHVGKGAFTLSHMRFGELWLVSATDLPSNCTQASAQDQRTGEVMEIVSGGGRIWSYSSAIGRRMNLAWESLPEADVQIFIDLHKKCFPNGTFWLDFGIDSTSPDLIFCYYRNGSLDITPQSSGYYSVNLEIQEVAEPNYGI